MKNICIKKVLHLVGLTELSKVLLLFVFHSTFPQSVQNNPQYFLMTFAFQLTVEMQKILCVLICHLLEMPGNLLTIQVLSHHSLQVTCS